MPVAQACLTVPLARSYRGSTPELGEAHGNRQKGLFSFPGSRRTTAVLSVARKGPIVSPRAPYSLETPADTVCRYGAPASECCYAITCSNTFAKVADS